jgi:CheY-like chemotaxis protein
MDGVEAMKTIRAEFADRAIKQVAVSASTMHHEARYYLEMGFDLHLPKPFRLEGVHEALIKLLGVEFVYEEDGAEPTVAEPAGAAVDNVVLPSALFSALKEAAELNLATEMEQHLMQLEAIGGDAEDLVRELRASLAAYDVDAILRILGQVRHE